MKSEHIIKPTSIDLFAGAGGMTEGLRKAGFKSLLANEYDEMAGFTFKTNHPRVPLVIKDVKDLSVEEVLEITKLSVGELSLMSGGPPCQGFSLAGPRIDGDPRNQMFREFVRLVGGLQPKVFIFENVSGIMSMSGGAVLKAIVTEFTNIGYRCEYKLINAADYGVPQARPRFIMIGTRGGGLIGFPEPTHENKTGTCNIFYNHKLPYVSVCDALGDLPIIEHGCGSEALVSGGHYKTKYQLDMAGVRKPGVIFNHRAIKHSKEVMSRYSVIPVGGGNMDIPLALRTKKNNIFRLDPSKPSRTITCCFRTDIIHYVLNRGLTVREAARLQSFDDDYQFFGNISRNAKYLTQDDQVGNSVPPLLAMVMGMHIKNKMGWIE